MTAALRSSRLSTQQSVLQSVSLKPQIYHLSRWQVSIRLESTQQKPREFYSRARARKKRVCGIYYIPSPSTTDPSTIIHKLPQVVREDRISLSKALILATPGLTRWFEKGNPFLQDAMRWMYTPVIANFQPVSFVGIVDGLPAPEYFNEWNVDHKRPHSLAEGLAVCLMSDIICVTRGAKDESTPALLRIQSRNITDLEAKRSLQEKNVFAKLSIPFANTLFINGSHHTAFKTVWHSPDAKSLVPKHKPNPLKVIQFNLPSNSQNLFRFNVPLYALTRHRKVLSSMGNVVREVEDDNGQPLKASAELEAAVPKFLAEQKAAGNDTQIQVFARVTPANPLPVSPQQVPDPSKKTLRALELDVPWSKGKIYHRIPHSTLWFGGQVYRVTGGGGGWGKKAGLLSLDPSVSFEPVDKSESSIFPDPDALDDEPNSPTDISALVPAGHTIQFFAAEVQEPIEPYFTTKSDHNSEKVSSQLSTPEEWSSSRNHRWLFGSTISTDATQSDSSKISARMAPPTLILPSCFGAISHAGVSVNVGKRTSREKAPQNAEEVLQDSDDGTPQDQVLKTNQWSTINEFRIDAPFSLFKAEHRLSEYSGSSRSNSDGPVKQPVGAQFRRSLQARSRAESKGQQTKDLSSEEGGTQPKRAKGSQDPISPVV